MTIGNEARPLKAEASEIALRNLWVIGFAAARREGECVELDKKDRLILEALQADARLSLAALGKRIGLSQPAMSERVRKLEAAGVIEGYGARISLRSLGLALQAIVRVRTTHEYIKNYVRLFEDIPEVLEADRVTGEDCFIVRCAFAEPQDLERVVDALAAHGSVTTSLVLSSVVRKRIPLQPGDL